jgi:hypothetical protein
VHNELKTLGWSSFLALMAASVSCCSVPASIDRDASLSPLSRADREARHSVPLPFSLFIPEGVRLGSDMRDYIESPEFGAFDSLATPEEAFDEIYFEALAMAHGDLTDAFLAASYGSFEHEFIPLVFFGAEVDLPLTSEDHSRFLLRVSHLPAHLYHIPEGDRDKLQHFFASAWLKSLLGMDWLVHLAGEAVEEGESLFVIGDARDPRDIHANNDGIRFAVQAAKSIEHVPSASLTPNP